MNFGNIRYFFFEDSAQLAAIADLETNQAIVTACGFKVPQLVADKDPEIFNAVGKCTIVHTPTSDCPNMVTVNCVGSFEPWQLVTNSMFVGFLKKAITRPAAFNQMRLSNRAAEAIYKLRDGIVNHSLVEYKRYTPEQHNKIMLLYRMAILACEHEQANTALLSGDKVAAANDTALIASVGRRALELLVGVWEPIDESVIDWGTLPLSQAQYFVDVDILRWLEQYGIKPLCRG